MSFDLYIAGIDEIPNDDFTETISEYRLKKAKNYKNEDDRKLSILSSLLLDKALKKTRPFGKGYEIHIQRLRQTVFCQC